MSRISPSLTGGESLAAALLFLVPAVLVALYTFGT
jgi:hypothetical protein